MTCHALTSDGKVVGFLCTGRGGWRVSFAACPWCCLPGDKPVRHLEALVYGGWCGSDYVCGSCGQEWSSDSDRLLRIPDEKREANKAEVGARPDPKCWDCADTGDITGPLDWDEPKDCPCGAPRC